MNSMQIPAVFLVVFLAIGLAIGRAPLIRFYVSNNCARATSGIPYYNYTTSRNVTSDTTASTGFQSYCVVSGAWRVELSYMEQATDFNISVGDSCVDCYQIPRVRTRYGNIRPLAGNDVTRATLALYSERNFKGHETLLIGDYTFNNTYSFMSYAFTSYTNWTWQVYHLSNWRGNSTCLRPTRIAEVTIVQLAALNVGSIRLGCRNNGQPLRYTGVGVLIAISLALIVPSISVIL